MQSTTVVMRIRNLSASMSAESISSCVEQPPPRRAQAPMTSPKGAHGAGRIVPSCRPSASGAPWSSQSQTSSSSTTSASRATPSAPSPSRPEASAAAHSASQSRNGGRLLRADTWLRPTRGCAPRQRAVPGPHVSEQCRGPTAASSASEKQQAMRRSAAFRIGAVLAVTTLGRLLLLWTVNRAAAYLEKQVVVLQHVDRVGTHVQQLPVRLRRLDLVPLRVRACVRACARASVSLYRHDSAIIAINLATSVGRRIASAIRRFCTERCEAAHRPLLTGRHALRVRPGGL
jgi:hypothetical protein